jgi:capsular polysaccharide biosynthesis protein
MTPISPGFAILPPAIEDAWLIPPETRAVLAPIWHRIWFPPRPVTLRVLEDVIVAQEGLVLHRDGRVVAETVQEHTPEQVDQARAALSGPVMEVAGTLILGRKPGSWNYGHFLVEILPRILLARRLGIAGRVMVQSAPAALRRVMAEALALAGVSADDLVQAGPQPMRVERLVLVEGLSEHGVYLSPLVCGLLEMLVAGIAADPDANLFVTRPAGPRRLADEDAVAAAAGIAGFRVIDPRAMAFAAQVAAFKGARRIVGVMGAGLANIVFARPGTELFLLAPAGMQDSFYWFLAGLRGLVTSEIRCRPVGPRTGQHPWDTALHLPTRHLKRLLDPAPLPPRPDPAVLAQALQTRFDAAFYLRHNPDVARSGVDPLAHFLAIGWREGRDPSAAFRLADRGQDINPLVRDVLRAHGVPEALG